MKGKTVLICVLAFAGTRLSAFVGRTLEVAPGGLTPQQALEKVRAAKAAGDKGAWTVRVKAGVHALRGTLTFRPEDSGSPEAPVRWVGEAGKSVLAGGEPVAGWRDDGDGSWSAPLPKAPDGKPAFFEQLWVNGRRAERARLPDKGWLKTRDMTCEEVKGSDPRNFVERLVVADPAAAPLAKTPADELAWAQMCLIDKWTFARRILRGVGAVSNGVAVTTHAPAAWPHFARWNANSTIVAFENVRAAFDAPGEWFYDAKAGRVRYRPLPGEDVAKAVVLAPSAGLSRLVAFAGDPGKGAFVHDVSFEGLSFEATASKTVASAPVAAATKGAFAPPASGPTESWQHQAAQSSDAAIVCEGARRVTWKNCAVRHTANYAFRFEDGCQHDEIVDCTLEDLGAGGIWMGARENVPPPGEGGEMRRREYLGTGPKSVAHNLVSNCTIRAAGKFNPEGTGVAIAHASFCRVIHCDIHDVMYTGVSVGWTWGWKGSVAQHNEIAYNRIHDLGKHEMSDMGGVYTLGTSFGTRVHHNVIHDVWAYAYGGWGLYTDEGSEDVVMDHNLVWNTEDGGFHQHYGTGNTVRNNVFAWNKSVAAFRLSRDKVDGVPCSANFTCNVVIVDGSPFMAPGCASVRGVWANNVWWDVQGKATFGGTKWEEWNAQDREWNSVCADPLFVDAKKFDFRLRPESPAFARGFKAWDYAEAGVK